MRESFNQISNGMNYHNQTWMILDMKLGTTAVTCTPAYSFLPCTTDVWGQIFLIIVYEYLLSLAQKFISQGSELFFKMFGTGIFGASLFQLLGTIPQVCIMLVTGISGTTETAEGLASMGIGMLAGSAVMSSTLVWGLVVAFGSHDLSNTRTSTNEETKRPFSITGYGVTTDVEASYTARIVLLSMIPFLILQLPKIFNSSTVTRVAELVALIITLAFLFIYCIYQVFEPWIQNRRLDYLLRKYVKDSNLLQSLLTPYGNPNIPIIREIFHKIDQNNNTYISTTEMQALILGVQLEGVGLKKENYVKTVMKEFDSSGDAKLNETEFVEGVTRWLNKANHTNNQDHDRPKTFRNTTSKKTHDEEQQPLVADKEGSAQAADNTWLNDKEGSTQDADNPWLNYFKATFLLIIGTVISFILGSPLMLCIQDVATAANIPTFIASYVVVPFALSFRLAVMAIKSAREKTETAISLTFSQIYGPLFMNNMMALSTFLVIVYIRDLSWDASAQVLVVLIVGLVMGFLTSFSTKFPFWTCILAFLLYPIALGLIYIFAILLGWS